MRVPPPAIAAHSGSYRSEADPAHWNLRRVNAALSRRRQKERHALQRVFLFVLSANYVPAKPGAPHGGAASLRRTSVLAAGQNLGAGGIHFRQAFERSQDSIKITTPSGVVIFMPCPQNIDAAARSSNSPSGPRRECGVNSERSEELRGGGFADPAHLNLRRVEAAYGRLNPKRKTRCKACLSFWSCYPDLNWGPHPYQGCALPTEL